MGLGKVSRYGMGVAVINPGFFFFFPFFFFEAIGS